MGASTLRGNRAPETVWIFLSDSVAFEDGWLVDGFAPTPSIAVGVGQNTVYSGFVDMPEPTVSFHRVLVLRQRC